MAQTAKTYVVDAHALVYYFENSPKLSLSAKQAFDEIDRGESLAVVPSIVIAEIMHMAEKGKTPLGIAEVLARIQQAANFAIAPLDLTVLLLMVGLRSHKELHDRVIVATALSFGAPLITMDRQIQTSGTVPCVW